MDFFRLNPQDLIAWLNTLPPEVMWVAMLLFCFSAALGLLRLFGTAGLYVYIAVAVVAANLQVLKATQFAFFSDPVALGTILFATTYLCTDILNEYYSPKEARRGVFLGFAALILMTVVMILTLGFRPLDADAGGGEWAWAAENHEHLLALYTPAPALLLAGMIAYLSSQLHDIWIYAFFKKITQGRFIWLRNNGSTLLSALIDNTIFSILAWVVFAESPLPWRVVIFTYILGTYGLRVVVSLLDTPVIYLARYCIPKEDLARCAANNERAS